MIKDVMVLLEGNSQDDVRMATAAEIARRFQSRIVGLFMNVMPFRVAEEGGNLNGSIPLLNKARTFGDNIEEDLARRLAELWRDSELRRYDLPDDTRATIATRDARAADVFVAVRPNGTPEDSNVVEEVLFGSGRHVFLVPDGMDHFKLDHVIIAWNGTRESARGLAEAIPYLKLARRVTVLVVVRDLDAEDEALLGTDAVGHLKHHGIEANLQQVKDEKDNVGATLLAEAERLQADLIVLGGYGHSRLREWLVGGVTQKLLHESHIPLLAAH